MSFIHVINLITAITFCATAVLNRGTFQVIYGFLAVLYLTLASGVFG